MKAEFVKPARWITKTTLITVLLITIFFSVILIISMFIIFKIHFERKRCYVIPYR